MDSYGSSLYITVSTSIKVYNSTTGANTSNISVGYTVRGLFIYNGIIYVGTQGNDIPPVLAYNTNGTLLSGFSTSNLTNIYIYSITVANNVIYAADIGNNRVSTFNATTGEVINLNFITVAGPYGIAVYDSTLFVGQGTYNLSTGALIASSVVTPSANMKVIGTRLYVPTTDDVGYFSRIYSLNIGNLNINAGSGSLTCGAITTNDNPINAGSGSLTCGAITTKNKSINVGSGALNCGPITCGTIYTNGITSGSIISNNNSTLTGSIAAAGAYDFTIIGSIVYVLFYNVVSTYNLATGSLIRYNILGGISNTSRICSYGSNLYITQQNSMLVFPTSGGNATSNIFLGLGSFGLYIYNGNIYIGTNGSPCIKAYDLSGTALSGFTSVTVTSGQILGLTIANNIIYAADSGNNRISTFNATTGATINLTFITGLSSLNSVDIYGNQLYVGYNGNVSVYDATTGALNYLFGNGSPIRIIGSSLGVINASTINIYSVTATPGTISSQNLLCKTVKTNSIVSTNDFGVTPISYYSFDSSSNRNIVNNQTSVYDLSLVILGANGNTIQLSNTYNYYNPYSLFQSTNSNSNYSYYVSKSSSIQTIGANFSVSAWVYPYTYSQPGMVWCLSDATYNNYITFAVNAGPSLFDLIITIVANGSLVFYGSPGANTANNSWYNYTLTCSYSGGVSTVRFYKDGSLILGYGGSQNISDGQISVNYQLFNASSNVSLYVLGGPTGSNSSPTSPNLAWGGANYSNGTKSQGFNGYLSNLNVFNSTLSQNQITYYYNNISSISTNGISINAGSGALKCGDFYSNGTVYSNGIRYNNNGYGYGNLIKFWWDGALRLYIDGTGPYTISVTGSDYRIKRNITSQIEPALSRIMKIRPIVYQFADYGTLFKSREELMEGFIAHELQEVIPSAVEGEKDVPNTIQTLRLDALCSVLTKGVQELVEQVQDKQSQITDLQTTVASQQSQIDSLTQQLADLKALVQTLLPNP
jgi:hypothetical protein